MGRGYEELSPETLAPQRNTIVIAIIIVESLFVFFSFRVFHVDLCVYIGFSEIHLTHLYNFGAWINSIGNYPQQ